MKKSEDNKSKAFYDIESDKSKGIGLGNIAMGNSPVFTTNEKGEIEFEIEVPKAPEEPETKKTKKHRWFKRNKKEETEEAEEVEETEETEAEETEKIESSDLQDEENGDFFKTLKTIVRILLITIIIIAIILVVWGLTSPTFHIKSIKVNETINADREAIIEIASGDIGNNIFIANFGYLKTQMEKLPYVYKANISRNLPDELNIEIEERDELFAFSTDSGYLLIDQYAYVMAIASGDIYSIPTVQGVLQNEYKVGDTLGGTDATKYKNLKFFMEAAKSINFEYNVSNIDYSNTNNLKFDIADLGIKVSYGEIDKNAISDKLIFLNEILKTCADNGFRGELDSSAENYLENTIFKKEI